MLRRIINNILKRSEPVVPAPTLEKTQVIIQQGPNQIKMEFDKMHRLEIFDDKKKTVLHIDELFNSQQNNSKSLNEESVTTNTSSNGDSDLLKGINTFNTMSKTIGTSVTAATSAKKIIEKNAQDPDGVIQTSIKRYDIFDGNDDFGF